MQLVPEDREGLESFTTQQSSIIASLSLIGGFDPRPRLGGTILLDSGLKGVISRIDSRGKVLAQMFDTNEVKKVPLTCVLNPVGAVPRPFQLDVFSRHEDAVSIATSLFSLLAQDFRIDKDKWKIVSDNSESINMALLRQQQLRLSIVKAIKVFFDNQNVLRHILKQPVFYGAAGITEDTSSGSDHGKKDANLLQKLLSKATHPSPIRAIFGVEELEAACLVVCQYLASSAAAKRNNVGVSNQAFIPNYHQDKQPSHEPINTVNSSKEATPSMASTTMETSDVADNSVVVTRAVTSKDLRKRKSRTRPTSPPPAANVQTLMEMGFPRKAVEQAVKALGGIGNLNPSPESIVGWLLEHQDQVNFLLRKVQVFRGGHKNLTKCSSCFDVC